MACNVFTQEMLDEARLAYHKLQLGQAIVEVTDQNGERVRFMQANRRELYLYIQQIERELCTAQSQTTSIRPIGFLF